MTYFTDSPFERMMIQRPRNYPGPSPSPDRPPGCRGCPYGTDKPCAGMCMKKTIQKKEDTEHGNT